MSDRTFYQMQVLELRRLLKEVGDDPILGPQFEDRLREAEQSLANAGTQLPSPPPLPRTTMFFRGGGVQDSMGIRPALAAEVLAQYEKMFTEQALHNEREIAREAGRERRPKGSTTPGLWFTGTPHGSFGLEFVPQSPEDPSLSSVYRDALTTVTDAILAVASDDEASADAALSRVPSAALKPMRMFMKALAHHGAELRVASQGQRSRSLSAKQIAKAAAQLEREVSQEEVVLNGAFQGVTLQSGHFDFLTDDNQLVSGTVGEDLPVSYLEDILRRTNQPAQAVVLVTTVRPLTGAPKITYVLLRAEDHPTQLRGGGDSGR